MSEYPKTLLHPSHQRSAIQKVSNGRFTDYHGTPDRYPPVTVNNADQEAQHRALGYRAHGEAPPAMTAYSEFPLILQHPDHEPAVPDEIVAKKEATGAITQTIIKGTPGKLHPVQVGSPEEEAAWTEKGYQRPGKADATAVHDATAVPYVPGRVTAEWPKLIDGKLVDERPVVDTTSYPRWLGDGGTDKDGNPTGKIVATEDEHRAFRPADFAPVLPAAEAAEILEDHQTLLARDDNSVEVRAMRGELVGFEPGPSPEAMKAMRPENRRRR